MHATILATFFEISRTVVATCSAGIALLLIGVLAAKNQIAEAEGLDKIVALRICVSLSPWRSSAQNISPAHDSFMNDVPVYMPCRLFWAYLVGCALIAATLSIATG